MMNKRQIVTSVCLQILIFLGVFSLPKQLAAQYSIAPTALWISHPNRSTDLIIRMAPDANPMEFNLSAEFLIPAVDSTGSFILHPLDSLDERNLAPHLRFSPRRFTLGANQEQIVRIAVQQWDSLENGEYWARVITSAKTVPITNETSTQRLNVSMGVEIRTIAGILYRKGPLSTGLNILSAWYKQEGNKIIVDTAIQRLGNAAWVGTVKMSLRDVQNRLVHTQDQISNVYLNDTYRYVFDLTEPLIGSYLLDLQWITKREQQTLPLIQAETKSTTIPIFLN
jgi:hypothetical protein